MQPLVTILKAHDFPPTTLRFNPESNLLISGSVDNSIRVVSVPETLAESSTLIHLTCFLSTLTLIFQPGVGVPGLSSLSRCLFFCLLSSLSRCTTAIHSEAYVPALIILSQSWTFGVLDYHYVSYICRQRAGLVLFIRFIISL